MYQLRNHFLRGHILYPMQRFQQILHLRNPPQSRKKESTNTIDQSKQITIKTLFSPTQTHVQFSQTTLIKPIHCKKSRRLIESTIISKTNHIKQHPGFYHTSLNLANILQHENNIKIENG